MNKLKILFIFLVLSISVSAAYADGNFTSLQSQIDNAKDSIELTQDYTYNNESDYDIKTGILIEKSNFIVDGNGHSIDALGHARIFNVTGYNVTFLNLNLMNGYSNETGSAISGNDLTLKNIIFNNNSGESGGGVYGIAINADNCTFQSNNAKNGGAIFINRNSTITNSIFKESHDINFALIYGTSNSTLLIENCTFLDSTANYATAICNYNSTRIKNSVFKNLHSKKSAGAVALKEISEATIENCIFINTTATKNGGALFLDVLGEENDDRQVFIINTTFINSSGDYGGALMQLGCNLTVINSKFIANSAIYDGSAIYTSKTSTMICNTTFTSNKILNDAEGGSAIYIDNSDFKISDSLIKDNENKAIYIYQTTANMENITFDNNILAIHGVFSDIDISNLTLINNTLLLNDTFYNTSIRKDSINLNIIGNSIKVSALPTRFDSREWGWVTPVKDQGDRSSCWVFGTIGAVESALLKATGIEYDLSENNMQNLMLEYSKMGVKNFYEGADHTTGIQYLTSWLGIFSEEYDIYDELGKISHLSLEHDTIHIQDLLFVEPRKNFTDNDEIKKAIMECGGVMAGYIGESEEPYFNTNNSAQYRNSGNVSDHDVCIVGWDDNYSKDKFSITPPGDGAFIIKNSWGAESGIDGYLYVSYYDTGLIFDDGVVGVIINNTEKYIVNYQTDIGGKLRFDEYDEDISYKINYKASGNDLISAVGTYFRSEGENYTLELYINNELKHVQNGTAPFYGFHTIRLTKEFPVKIGDNFTVVMTKKTIPILADSRVECVEDTIFMNDGEGWFSLPYNETTSLKVYAKAATIVTGDIEKIYKNGTDFTAIVSGANETVAFEINGRQYNRTSDDNGLAKIAINLNPGEYVIKTTYDGFTVENTIKVLPTLIADNLVKYFRNDSQFYVSLVDGAGKAVPGVNITMNINGVFYNRTTNANGTAKLNINLNPGEYILTAIDPLTGLEMSYNITVLPVLTADDVNMTYMDGTQFAATLVDGTGKALAGVNITFNINGIFYNRTTDEDGIARLNIRLMPSEYIITSQYENAVTSNKITITSKED
ncbi:MAG: hypothetical protein J6B73_07550 [Methanobrevibacter sp.]|uniref:C1 family peptidase n=1 Tax=Methanobrevibacter sp. TaxID=66852 RepID=UPI001B0FE8DD|nr:C1 family peptidase [Methanobrevibacter sp.]MBO5151993.1 hypothetical protein [Methanobrevibacter sp.]